MCYWKRQFKSKINMKNEQIQKSEHLHVVQSCRKLTMSLKYIHTTVEYGYSCYVSRTIAW